MNLKIKQQNLRGIFDLNKKKEELNSLEQVTTKEDFWQNVDNANVINTKIAHLKKEINLYDELSKEINEKPKAPSIAALNVCKIVSQCRTL